MSEATPQEEIRTVETRPRIWPAVLIVSAYLGVALQTLLFASSNMHGVIGFLLTPLIATVLLIIWWLAASRVCAWERLTGLALCVAGPTLVYFSQKANGELVLMITIPAMTTGVVGVLLVTSRLRWPLRRLLAAMFMIGCTVFFTGIRADSMGGDMLPVLSWRWTPTSEERLAMSDTETGPRLGGTAQVPLKVGPDDWPEFRGPVRDGRLAGVTFATDWDEAPPREVWRKRVGLGWSSFAVVGDYLFTQEQRGQYELVVCYEAGTGEEVWANGIATRFEDSMGSGPRGTPTFRQGRLYTQGATGVVLCLEAATGEIVWEKDLKEDVGAKTPTWGFSSSPLVVDGRVIVFAGAAEEKGVVAYDQASGDLAWAAGKGTHGYSSGHLAEIDGVPQFLMMSNYGLQSFIAQSGQVLWEHEWDIGGGNMRIIQPLIPQSGTVLVGTGSGKGTRRLRVQKKDDAWNVEEEWTAKRFRPYFNDFVYYEGHCYGFDGNRFCCMDAQTGGLRWKGENCGGQVLLLTDMGVLLILNEDGELMLIEAAPDEQRILARIQAIEGKTWNHPVVAKGRLYIRNSDEAVCFDLGVQ